MFDFFVNFWEMTVRVTVKAKESESSRWFRKQKKTHHWDADRSNQTTVCHLVPRRATSSYENNTHIRRMLSNGSQVRAGPNPVLMQMFSRNPVFPLFLPPNCLVYFSSFTLSGLVTKSFSTVMTDVLDRKRAGLQDIFCHHSKDEYISARFRKRKNITNFFWSLLNHQRRGHRVRVELRRNRWI